MKSAQRILLMGALVGGLAMIVAKTRRHARLAAQHDESADATSGNSSIDDVPTIQAAATDAESGAEDYVETRRMDENIAPGAPF